MESHEFFQQWFGGNLVLQRDECLCAARLTDHGGFRVGNIGRQFSYAKRGNSEGIEELVVAENRILRVVGMFRGHLVGEQGQTLKCDLGLTQQSVQDPSVVQDRMNKLRVVSKPKLSATFESCERLRVELQLECTKSEHAEPRSWLLFLDSNEVLECSACFREAPCIE